jgi:hypothetical protein
MKYSSILPGEATVWRGEEPGGHEKDRIPAGRGKINQFVHYEDTFSSEIPTFWDFPVPDASPLLLRDSYDVEDFENLASFDEFAAVEFY